MNSEFINKLLENGASKSMFDSFSKDIQLVVLAQAGNWIQISKMPLTYSQMERYQNDILWNVAIHYMENIPLEFIKIKKRSVSLYVVFNYFNLSEELVKRKFLRNATFHDRVEAVAIWYSSPNCRHLIEKKYDKNIPIIAVTGKTDDKDIQISIDAGADYHINKPYDPNVLLNIVSYFLNK